MDDFDPNPRAVSDPAADGLPEVADDDSHADEERDSSRIADGPSPYALPPDREDGPVALNDFGTTAQEHLEGERLGRRLRREEPEVGLDSVAEEPGPALATDAELSQTVEEIEEDSDELESDDVVDPRLGSHVSMYDRDVRGIPTLRTVGRLTGTDDPYGEEVAFDAGLSGGGFSAEEGAMHEVPEDDLEDQSDGDDPYGPDYPLGPIIRTGAEQPWEAEDLAVAEGRDPTPANVERAQRELDELGPAAIEKTVP